MNTAPTLSLIKELYQTHGEVDYGHFEEMARLLAEHQVQGRGLEVGEESPLTPLVELAGSLGEQVSGHRVELCAIVNGKCGLCSEDCAYCAQSGLHAAGLKIQVTPLLEPDRILQAAQRAEEAGAHRFSVVTSGNRLTSSEFFSVVQAVELVAGQTTLQCCASLGMLDSRHFQVLKNAGLVRYHHNVETARSYFPIVCTTHTYEERLETIMAARSVGLEICCGGILNLGETWAQRLEMATQLAQLEPQSVPINFLDPRPGTPLGRRPLAAPVEALLSIIMFRLVLPRTVLRLAGGRRESLGNLEREGLRAGVNGLMVGDYLTTGGPGVERDLKMLGEMGLVPGLIEGGGGEGEGEGGPTHG